MVQQQIKIDEIWRDVVGYEGLYLVSNYGNIKSLPRKTTSGKVLKQIKQKSGHLFVGLSKNGKEKHHRIHKLVMQTFVGSCPANMECCHNDGDPTNNYTSNLRYDTHKSNQNDMRKHGTFVPPPIHYGCDNHNSKLDRISIQKIRKLLTDGIKVVKIAEIFDVHITTIYRIKDGKLWGHI